MSNPCVGKLTLIKAKRKETKGSNYNTPIQTEPMCGEGGAYTQIQNFAYELFSTRF